jgi:plasmid stabilization system protein ParE
LPNAGALPRDRILKSLGYRYLVHKEYLTFYLVDEQQKKVFVMAIFNGKRDYMRVMRKLI